ncbi:acyl carrier protein [Actinomadura opuntiae]|uniref:acyl carrier protein n=1 Tax=Actinomadura sp. OS1-43 TaxID=604315 RepID=UPI00255A84D6|nr:acyl carrier protein [Actinomadura sp. OS1-43]MDL4817265.1 acyl carrier protein [Actinomadura sp. OS1-43]
MWDSRFEEILRGHLPYLSAGDPLRGDTRLFDLGLDSIGVVEVLAALERTYNVRFTDDALNMENFATPDTLWGELSKMIEAAA